MNLRYAKTNTIVVTVALLFLCAIFVLTSMAAANEDRKVLTNYVFTATENPMLQAKKALSKALTENRYALLVLGAQWCHDSVSLAENFSTDEMQTVLSDRYITQFIDVAYLEDRRDITNLVGYPNYFATPTVLIVDPVSNTIVNMDSIKKWQSADSVELQVYIEQFSRFNHEEAPINALQKTTTSALKVFETQQSERLQRGYQILGPLLAASDVEDTSTISGKESERFLKLWREVKRFRTHLQVNIHELRNTDLDNKQQLQKLAEAMPKAQSWELPSNKN